LATTRLPAGEYQLRIAASDALGNRAQALAVPFTVRR
jgi:hypothetical protein